MRCPTKHMNELSDKYGVAIWWGSGANPAINVRTRNTVTFHRVVSEMAWDMELCHAAMVRVNA